MKMPCFLGYERENPASSASRGFLRNQDPTQSFPEVSDHWWLEIFDYSFTERLSQGQQGGSSTWFVSCFIPIKPGIFQARQIQIFRREICSRERNLFKAMWQTSGRVWNRNLLVWLTPPLTPAIISLLLLSSCVCSIVSNQICSHLPVAHGLKAVIFDGPIMERKMCLFSSPFPPHLGNSDMLIFLYSWVQIELSQWDRQEQWMHWRKSLLCTEVPLLFHDCPATPPSYTVQILFHQLLKMQKESVWLGRAGIHSALCSSWACCLWRRTCSAPECAPAGLLHPTWQRAAGHDPRAVCLPCAAALAAPSRVHPHSAPPGACGSQRSLSACDNCCKSFYK